MKGKNNRIAPEVMELAQQLEELEVTASLLEAQLRPVCEKYRCPAQSNRKAEPLTAMESQLQRANHRIKEVIRRMDALSNAVQL